MTDLGVPCHLSNSPYWMDWQPPLDGDRTIRRGEVELSHRTCTCSEG
jgi:hypothetical protein